MSPNEELTAPFDEIASSVKDAFSSPKPLAGVTSNVSCCEPPAGIYMLFSSTPLKPEIE
jgi:hypothetical protein